MPTDSTLSAFIWFCITVATVLAVLILAARHHSARCYPPGPRPLPLLGNIFDFDPCSPQLRETLTQWKYAHGDIVHLSSMGNHIIILNSYKAVSELLDKRSANYSHRPIFTVLGELMRLDESLPLQPYGPKWRAARKLSHIALSPAAVRKYHTLQEEMAAIMACDFLDDPGNFMQHVRMAAGRIIMTITYGIPLKESAEYIAHAEDTMKIVSESEVPGTFLADFLPILKYAPAWVPFQRKAAFGRRMIEHLVEEPFQHVKASMRDHLDRPSFTRDLLTATEITDDIDDAENIIKWTSGSLFAAGGETTYTTVLVFIIAMIMHPDIQAKAHAELVVTLGSATCPTLSDRARLPYLEAVIKEVMRWHPALPLSIARRAASDDVYEGYFIPAGTVILPNCWALASETSSEYPAEEFHPERFTNTVGPSLDPNLWAFGFGRRICPGKHLAENSVFILIATLLATFTFAPLRTDELFTPEFEPNLVSYPKPFKCSFVVRDPSIVDAMRHKARDGTRS